MSVNARAVGKAKVLFGDDHDQSRHAGSQRHTGHCEDTVIQEMRGDYYWNGACDHRINYGRSSKREGRCLSGCTDRGLTDETDGQILTRAAALFVW